VPFYSMKNKVQLITYTERLSGQSEPGDLKALTRLLEGPLANVFGGVHLLPFYDSIHGTDAGFDPKDHLSIDPTLGTWSDVARLAQSHDVMADVIVNHVSAQSPQFQDAIHRGEASPYTGLFLTQEKIFPDGATSAQLEAIYRPRPTPAFTPYTFTDGRTRLMWTTFTDQQIDIDVAHPAGAHYLQNILKTLAHHGVRMIRLDAVGYAIKIAGSSCFMLPQTFEFISQLSADARAHGIEVLVEVHSYYATQIEIAKQVDCVYDFALPPLLLHAFHFGTSGPLKRWIDVRPHNAVTVLDTHDGIGIIDIGADKADRLGKPGLVPDHELDALVEAIHRASKNQSRLATGDAASNLDLYQVNCTYFDALGSDVTKYLLCRAVQFFLPGVPQVYYVGLLAGHNDLALLARTGVGRDINRHYFNEGEIAQALQRPVVQRLIALIKLRNTHVAFQGVFNLLSFTEHAIILEWRHGVEFARLVVNFKNANGQLRYSDAGQMQTLDFVHEDAPQALSI
jgi:sucrose phosphorylase